MRSVLALSFIFSLEVFAEERKSRLFEIGKTTTQQPLFIQETQIDDQNTDLITWNAVMRDNKGQIVMTEKARMTMKEMIYQYVEQFQIKEAYELEVEDSRVIFKTFQIQEKEKPKLIEKKSIKKPARFIMGPLTERFLGQNWDQLLKGETIEVDFGIFELQRFVRFEFRKTKETEQILQIEMKPANFFISVLVDPILIELDKNSRRMVRYQGRTPVRINKNGQLKPFDSEILYPQ